MKKSVYIILFLCILSWTSGQNYSAADDGKFIDLYSGFYIVDSIKHIENPIGIIHDGIRYVFSQNDIKGIVDLDYLTINDLDTIDIYVFFSRGEEGPYLRPLEFYLSGGINSDVITIKRWKNKKGTEFFEYDTTKIDHYVMGLGLVSKINAYITTSVGARMVDILGEYELKGYTLKKYPKLYKMKKTDKFVKYLYPICSE